MSWFLLARTPPSMRPTRPGINAVDLLLYLTSRFCMSGECVVRHTDSANVNINNDLTPVPCFTDLSRHGDPYAFHEEKIF